MYPGQLHQEAWQCLKPSTTKYQTCHKAESKKDEGWLARPFIKLLRHGTTYRPHYFSMTTATSSGRSDFLTLRRAQQHRAVYHVMHNVVCPSNSNAIDTFKLTTPYTRISLCGVYVTSASTISLLAGYVSVSRQQFAIQARGECAMFWVHALD